jgi:molybdopterin synthase catalytic subunit
MKIVQMQKEPIDVTGLLHKSGTVEDGAILTFIGTARKNSMGREVHYLHYDVYEDMAMRELDKIVKHAVETWPLTNCIVIHRYGRVNIGEASVFIAVSVKHREEGFAALRYIIDTIKKTVPIWKKEHYADGSVWVSERP